MSNFNSKVSLKTSRGFSAWVSTNNISLLISSATSQSLLQLSTIDDQINVYQHQFETMQTGQLLFHSNSLLSQHGNSLWKYDNFLPSGEQYQSHDALLMPVDKIQLASTDIGDLQSVDEDTHTYVMADSATSTIMRVDDNRPSTIVWTPPFITDIVKDNRCNLNGIAVVDNKPRYATAAAQSDSAYGWHEAINYGGVIMDIRDNRVLVDGLALPHAPRWHGEQLWLLNSGRGELGYIDLKINRFEPIIFGPGFMRGLVFWQQYAIIGLSSKMPYDLPVPEVLAMRCGDRGLSSGLMIVDLTTGKLVEWVNFEGDSDGVVDIAILPFRNPLLILPEEDSTPTQAVQHPVIRRRTNVSAVVPIETEQENTPQEESRIIHSPRVSVVIPAYNAEQYIAETIESVLNQTYSDYEIVVVNDGSTDNTRDVLEPYMDRIRYYEQENRHVCYTRNRGVELASGELIAFLDADDFWYPDKLEQQVRVLDQQPSVGMVQSGWHSVTEDGKVFNSQELWKWFPELTVRDWLVGIVLPSAMMIRKHWFEQVGGFAEEWVIVEDVELTVRLAMAGCKSIWLPRICVAYRHHDTGLMSQTVKQAEVREQYYDYFFSDPSLPDQIKALEREIKYQSMMWAAYRLYRTNHYDLMVNYLQKSVDYRTGSLVDLPHDWLTFFKNGMRVYQISGDMGLEHLQSLSEWQILITNLNAIPRMSVIIPTYNHADFICDAIDSVLRQTYQDFEIIVVDDGSTDNTADIVQSYADRIQYIQQENAGPATARNQGFEASRGEIIAYLDADDTYSAEHLANHLAAFEQDDELGLSTAGWYLVNTDGTLLNSLRLWQYAPDGHISSRDVLVHRPVLPGAWAIKRAWIETIGGFDPNTPIEDVDFMVRLAFAGCKMAWTRADTVAYRVGSNSHFAQDVVARAHDFEAMYHNFFHRTDLPESIHEHKHKSFQMLYLWLSCRLFLHEHYVEMANYLQKYIDLMGDSVPSFTLQRYILEKFSEYGKNSEHLLDLEKLLQLDEWAQVVRPLLTSPPIDLNRKAEHIPLADLVETLIDYPITQWNDDIIDEKLFVQIPESIVPHLDILQKAISENQPKRAINTLKNILTCSQSTATLTAIKGCFSIAEDTLEPPPSYPQIVKPQIQGKRPFWSVILLTYDRLDFFENTLMSVVSQMSHNDDMEIIVLNDGGPANIREKLVAIIEQVGRSRVRFYAHSHNVGQAHICNLGIQQAKGRWIHILHDDDQVLPGFYSRLRQGLEQYPHARMGWVRHYYDRIDDDASEFDLSPLLSETAGIVHNAREYIARTSVTQFAATVVKRDIYETIGGFSPHANLCLDWDMWQRIATQYAVYYEPEVLAVYRIHSRSITTEQVSDAITFSDCSRVVRGNHVLFGTSDKDRLLQVGKDGLTSASTYYWQSAIKNEQHEVMVRYIIELLCLDQYDEIIAMLLPHQSIDPSIYRTLTAPENQFSVVYHSHEGQALRNATNLQIPVTLQTDEQKDMLAKLAHTKSIRQAIAISVFQYTHSLPKDWLLGFDVAPSMADALIKRILTLPKALTGLGEGEQLVDCLYRHLSTIHQQLQTQPNSTYWQSAAWHVRNHLQLGILLNTTVDIQPIFALRNRIIRQIMMTTGAKLDMMPPERPTDRTRIRLGILLPVIKLNSDLLATIPIFENLDRDEFEVIIYYQECPDKRLLKGIISYAEQVHSLPENPVQYLRSADLDILLFAVNLMATTLEISTLAEFRIARVQIAHALTPEDPQHTHIDYIIGSKPQGVPASEKLLAIPSGGLCYSFEHIPKPIIQVNRNMLGIPEDAVVMFASASMAQINMDTLAIWLEQFQLDNVYILLYLQNSQDNYTHTFLRHLHQTASFIDVEQQRLIILENLPTPADIKVVMGLADIYLNPVYFGDPFMFQLAISCGLPTIVIDKDLPRFQQSVAILRDANLDDQVITDRVWKLVGGYHVLAKENKRLYDVPKMFFETRDYSNQVATIFQEVVASSISKSQIADTIATHAWGTKSVATWVVNPVAQITAQAQQMQRLLIVANARTGTSLLASLINSHPQCSSGGEIFQRIATDPILFANRRAVQSGYDAYITKLLDFQYINKLNTHTLLNFSEDGWKFVHLIRNNVFEHVMSFMVANQTQLWNVFHGVLEKDTMLELNLHDLRWRIKDIECTQDNREEALVSIPHLTFEYEQDLLDAKIHQPTADKVFEYLGIESAPVHSNLRKQAPKDYRTIIGNIDDVFDVFREAGYEDHLPKNDTES